MLKGLVSGFFFLFSSVAPAQKVVPLDRKENMRFIQNEQVKVGIDLNLGGAITYLADPQHNINLINNSDWGRQVQMSFYSGPVPFEPNGKKSHPAWTFIGWNPIQSGDVAGNKSKVLEYSNTGNTLYVKCIPMHWPLDNVPGECTYECWISLDGNAVKIKSRIVNNRPDKTQYMARGQELPAVYTNAPWHHLVSYRAGKPFTGDTLSTIPNHNLPTTKNIEWAHWQATESWAANVDDNNYGLGVWNPDVQAFSGGYFGDSSFVGGSYDSPTAYIAPNSTDVLDYNIRYDYNYVLILGSLEQIRGYVYQHHRSHLPDFRFINDRQHWYFKNTTDLGWPPKKNGLKIWLKKDAQMIAPLSFWCAEEAPLLYFTAKYPAGVKKAKVYWHSFGIHFSERQSMEFDIMGDDRMHTYKLPLGEAESYNGNISGLKIILNTGPAVEEKKTVEVQSVSFIP